jgi:hypothetical protein
MKIFMKPPSRSWLHWLTIGFVSFVMVVIAFLPYSMAVRISSIGACIGTLCVVIADLARIKRILIIASLRILGICVACISFVIFWMSI